jgi:hypothetical protein
MDHRIVALERGIRVWRCLTAAGFLTALGAFWLAVFGLGQLENTYFIGEMVASSATVSSVQGTGNEVEAELVARKGAVAPAHDPPVQVSHTLEGLATLKGTHDRVPGPGSPVSMRDR